MELHSWPAVFECLVTENVKHPRNLSMWFHKQLKMAVRDKYNYYIAYLLYVHKKEYSMLP